MSKAALNEARVGNQSKPMRMRACMENIVFWIQPHRRCQDFHNLPVLCVKLLANRDWDKYQQTCSQMAHGDVFASSYENSHYSSLHSERQFTAFSSSWFGTTRLFASTESFRRASRVNPPHLNSQTPFLSLIITAGSGHIDRMCYFSPIWTLRLGVNALYLENNAFLAGSQFLCQAPKSFNVTIFCPVKLTITWITCQQDTCFPKSLKGSTGCGSWYKRMEPL